MYFFIVRRTAISIIRIRRKTLFAKGDIPQRGLQTLLWLLRLSDGTEYRLDLSSWGPQIAAVLQAVISV